VGQRQQTSVSARTLLTALRQRYPAGGYALVEEVGNATGAACRRHADALVMSLWPSHGLWLAGFELKVDRRDFQRERKDPQKADAIHRHCDYFWLVVPSLEVAHFDEVPETWGVLTLHGKTLRVAREATKTPRAEEIARPFVGALLRAAQRGTEQAVQRELGARVSDVYAKAKAAADGELARAKADLAELRARCARFQEMTGISLEHDNLPRVGEVVKRLLSLDARGFDRFGSLVQQLKEYAANAETAYRGVRALEQEVAAIIVPEATAARAVHLEGRGKSPIAA
jgi:hypothetical protein